MPFYVGSSTGSPNATIGDHERYFSVSKVLSFTMFVYRFVPLLSYDLLFSLLPVRCQEVATKTRVLDQDYCLYKLN